MRLLVTGAAGFIGFNLIRRLSQNKKNIIFGIDNIDNYYDINLKKKRLNILKKNKNFFFNKIDICNEKALLKIFRNKKFDYVIHLAAQAGVRYSFVNPKKYIKVNIEGFLNILELSKKNTKGLLFASSSSVYGDNIKKVLKEDNNYLKPVSLYGATKLNNEQVAEVYSKLYKFPTVGIRFFTVYGPWGRPDMSLYTFTKNIINGKSINLFNYGKHERDFTFIDDATLGIQKILNSISNLRKTKNVPHEIYNISSAKPVSLNKYVKSIERAVLKKAKIKYLPLQKGDVVSTKSNIEKLKSLGYRPKENINSGILKFVEWFKKYQNIK